MIKNLLVVFIGSGLGGGCRFVLSKLIQGSTMMAFPLATFVVNILGCLLIGLFYGMFDKGALMNNNLRLLLTVGFCGGFTTFSTFMNENLQILRANNILRETDITIIRCTAPESASALQLLMCCGRYEPYHR